MISVDFQSLSVLHTVTCDNFNKYKKCHLCLWLWEKKGKRIGPCSQRDLIFHVKAELWQRSSPVFGGPEMGSLPQMKVLKASQGVNPCIRPGRWVQLEQVPCIELTACAKEQRWGRAWPFPVSHWSWYWGSKLETHVSTLKDFEVYSESAEESLRIFKQIWKTSHNGRVGWRIGGSWKKQCRGI